MILRVRCILISCFEVLIDQSYLEPCFSISVQSYQGFYQETKNTQHEDRLYVCPHILVCTCGLTIYKYLSNFYKIPKISEKKFDFRGNSRIKSILFLGPKTCSTFVFGFYKYRHLAPRVIAENIHKFRENLGREMFTFLTELIWSTCTYVA